MKNTSMYKKNVLNLTVLFFVVLLTAMSLACDGNDNAQANGSNCVISDPERASRVSGTLDRVEQALALNDEATLYINDQDPDFVLLEQGDESFGQAVLDMLNGKVQRGECQVSEDLSVECLGLSRSLGSSANCTTKWWGECCFEDTEVTREICSGLAVDGTGADIICQLIPVLDAICDIIVKVGVAPVEGEVCECSLAGESSSFHATWLDVVWFKCGDDC